MLVTSDTFAQGQLEKAMLIKLDHHLQPHGMLNFSSRLFIHVIHRFCFWCYRLSSLELYLLNPAQVYHVNASLVSCAVSSFQL
jgi:hypothetical protein